MFSVRAKAQNKLPLGKADLLCKNGTLIQTIRLTVQNKRFIGARTQQNCTSTYSEIQLHGHERVNGL